VDPTLIGPGTKFSVTVADSDLNQNPQGTDNIPQATTADWVKLTSDATSAPTSTLGMEETGPNTGIFKATIKLSPRASTNAVPTFGGSGKDFTYQALPGDLVSVKYTDTKDGSGNKVVMSKIFKVVSVNPAMNATSASIAPGETITLVIADADANSDGEALDSIRIRITSDSDAVGFDLSAQETGVNTGVFKLNIPTTSTVSSGSITVKKGDSVSMKYTDTYPADYSDRVKQVNNPSKDFIAKVVVGSVSAGTGSTSPSKPMLKDFNGAEVKEVTVGSQVVLSTTIKNNNDAELPYVAIVEVRDSDKVTVFLSWQTGKLPASSETGVGIAWTPEAAGTYSVRTFVLSDLGSPQVLSPVAESTVTVT
jgi:hypothetical protein